MRGNVFLFPHMDDAKPFAELLAAEIERAGISKKTLARRVAGDPQTSITVEAARSLIYKYLRGEHFPNQQMREALARALGLTPDFFGSGPDMGALRTQALMRALTSHLAKRYDHDQALA